MNRKIAALALLPLLAATPAFAAEPPAEVRAECVNCHMFFPANWLAAESWTKIMGNLSSHFGEDATLSEAKRAKVLDYLTANAADAKTGRISPAARGIKGETPLRLTDTYAWLRKHGRIKERVFANPKIKSKANCVACHPKAEMGVYED